MIDITLNMDGKEEFFSYQASKEELLKALIVRCRNEERIAQFELYKTTFDFLYRIAIRYERNHDDAVAIINEAFYNALKKLDSFQSDYSFYPWMKTILIHCIFNQFKKSNRIKNGGNHQMMSFDDEAVLITIEPEILEKIDSEHVLLILDCLPELTRKVFNLFVMEEYSHKDIAALLGMSVNTSKWHVYEGKKRLLERIKKTNHQNYGSGKSE